MNKRLSAMTCALLTLVICVASGCGSNTDTPAPSNQASSTTASTSPQSGSSASNAGSGTTASTPQAANGTTAAASSPGAATTPTASTSASSPSNTPGTSSAPATASTSPGSSPSTSSPQTNGGGATSAGQTTSSQNGNTAAAQASQQGNLPLVEDPTQPPGASSGIAWAPVSKSELTAPSGPYFGDILQTGEGDCTVLATLGSIISQNPNALSRLLTATGRTQAGHTVYTIHLFNADSSPRDITVDDEFLTHAAMAGYAEYPNDRFATDASNSQIFIIWPNLIQKAAAAYWGGYPNFSTYLPTEMMLLTGSSGANYACNDSQVASALSAALAAKEVVTASSYPTVQAAQAANPAITSEVTDYTCLTGSGSNTCVIAFHLYSVLAFDGTTVTLRNPIGVNPYGDGSKQDGVLTMPFSTFQGLMSQVFIGPKA